MDNVAEFGEFAEATAEALAALQHQLKFLGFALVGIGVVFVVWIVIYEQRMQRLQKLVEALTRKVLATNEFMEGLAKDLQEVVAEVSTDEGQTVIHMTLSDIVNASRYVERPGIRIVQTRDGPKMQG